MSPAVKMFRIVEISSSTQYITLKAICKEKTWLTQWISVFVKCVALFYSITFIYGNMPLYITIKINININFKLLLLMTEHYFWFFDKLLLRGPGQNCTKTKLHEGTKLHKDKFALRVNFARATNLHGESNLHSCQICTG